MMSTGKAAFFAVILLLGINAVTATPRNPTPARPGEDNEGLPDKVQLKYRNSNKVTRDKEQGRLTTFLKGNYPPFEIIDTRSEIDWDHAARYWGGSFTANTAHGGADGRWLLSRTNGTIDVGFNGTKFGASPRVQLVQNIEGRITVTIDGNGADFSCKAQSGGSSKWICSGQAGSA
ncbi:unnamed protein product [Tilletia controversa]|uniref:Uncharacterized protein n=3 Tax=Tilletia TaxID=13289 RepID=A0A8X7MPY0_9BASI|nr:hypothetical protein CF336_g5352 [Tilletia laevis]KAE8245081.1 hypothetical protein A4X06_0g5836 [Tilletia controversa]KAE8258345.1 hypothetical protein A4X03_0g4411 [Tilletia caries]KAE8197467.1 hypothetical protein CF335_g4607 [Tilletia laevis]CAD6889439.1 unnamed protein product [Tilletia caries]